jgi:hypothetical protein
MSYKICQVIFSANRVEYLTRTLDTQKLLDFSECNVDKIFFDDLPLNRNDRLITELVKSHGYQELHLHPVNLGLSVTWTEFWNLIKNRDYDYIWHQEDDVEILEPVKIVDLIKLLEDNPTFAQIVLKRQAWYSNEEPPKALDTDIITNIGRVELNTQLVFSPMASLYSIERVRFDYSTWYRENYPDTNLHSINFNEGMIGVALYGSQQLIPARLKNINGNNIINHIGEYFSGKRVLPDEPGYASFEKYDPDKKYNSRNGSEYQS